MNVYHGVGQGGVFHNVDWSRRWVMKWSGQDNKLCNIGSRLPVHTSIWQSWSRFRTGSVANVRKQAASVRSRCSVHFVHCLTVTVLPRTSSAVSGLSNHQVRRPSRSLSLVRCDEVTAQARRKTRTHTCRGRGVTPLVCDANNARTSCE